MELQQPIEPHHEPARLRQPPQHVHHLERRARRPVGLELTLQAGVFLSPIGPEAIPIKDNWNWSRSNLFFGLPFYHTGVKLSYPVSGRWVMTVAAFNGWNSVTDLNSEKSVMAQAVYAVPERLALSLLYFGGVERPHLAPEGRAWRHLLDAHLQLRVTPWLELLVHANAGLEPNALDVNGWLAGAVYVRFQPLPQLFVAIRGDAFWERPGAAAAIFWPVPWVASGTLTLDYRPVERISLRLEFRHDHAGGDAFFSGRVRGDGSALAPFVPNRAAQDTLTAGVVGWF